MKMLKDLVLIEADPAQTKTKSGFYIQEEWKSLPPFGTVKSVGPEVTEVKEGDRVMFERYGAISVKGSPEDNNKHTNLRVCKESLIIAIVEDESK